MLKHVTSRKTTTSLLTLHDSDMCLRNCKRSELSSKASDMLLIILPLGPMSYGILSPHQAEVLLSKSVAAQASTVCHIRESSLMDGWMHLWGRMVQPLALSQSALAGQLRSEIKALTDQSQ
eukprot:6323201-Amphidinium_carterae.1